jgi:hypothetical protein
MELLSSWDAIKLYLGVAFLLGFAPGAALRLILLAYPSSHPRRRELVGELHAVRRLERPFFVFEQLELALFEGLSLRRAARRTRKASRRHGFESQFTRFRMHLMVASIGMVIALTAAGVASVDGGFRVPALTVALIGAAVMICSMTAIRRSLAALERATARRPGRR